MAYNELLCKYSDDLQNINALSNYLHIIIKSAVHIYYDVKL